MGLSSRFHRLVWAVIGCLWLLLVAGGAHAGDSLRRNAVVAAVERVSPAVVNISTVIHERVSPGFGFGGEEFFRDFFPDFFTRRYTHTSLGSGVIIDGTRGYIITNHHVVARASQIKVVTADQKQFEAHVVGSDPRSDLAVLQVRSPEPLPEIPMGDSSDLMIGETVIAIGNPFGLSHTVTTGVVSAVHRTVRTEDTVYRDFIQTDASINPGNSGGPLLNIEGRLIGINTAIYQKAQGIGFAIPINKARRIVRELIQAGEVRLPWLGLEIQELSDTLRQYFELPGDRGGVLIRDVVPGSPAAGAGVKRGDILLAIGETPVGSVSAYREIVGEFLPGETMELRVWRKGDEIQVAIVPTAFPRQWALELVERRLGITVSEADEATLRRYGLERAVVITRVRKDSEAGRIGLEPGDVILKINQTPVVSLEDFKRAIGRYHLQASLTLLVRRGPYGYSVTLPF